MAVEFTAGCLHLGSALTSSTPVSMFAWANPSLLDLTSVALCINDATDASHFSMEFAGGGNDYVSAAHVGGFTFAEARTPNGSVVPGVWNAFGAVFEATQQTAYINGSGTTNTTVGAALTLTDTQIGARILGDGSIYRQWHGCLAMVTCWVGVVLSPSDMALLATGVEPTDVHNASIVMYVPLLDDATKLVNTVGPNLTVYTGSFATCTSSPPGPPVPPDFPPLVGGGNFTWATLLGPITRVT
jgi:hypothetical protein